MRGYLAYAASRSGTTTTREKLGNVINSVYVFSLPVGPMGVILIMMLIWIILGCFIDWIGILLLTCGNGGVTLAEDADLPSGLAALIGADAKELVFTSGATESNNIAIGNAGVAADSGTAAANAWVMSGRTAVSTMIARARRLSMDARRSASSNNGCASAAAAAPAR